MRKLILPALLLTVLPALYLLAARYFPDLLATALHATPATGPAASDAEVAAGQQASGFVPFAAIGSKLLAAVVAYVLFRWLPFQLQRVTHPAPTAWAKGPGGDTPATEDNSYSKAFAELSYVEKFTVYGRLQLVQAILAAASLVFGCLVI